VGNGLVEEFVRPTLQEKTDLLFVITDKDNINLMIAQRVKQIFQVQRVVAVVHDSILAGLYKELGVETVCPTDLVIKDLLQTIQER
jgi:trk system potassium uptake protein TrkA